MLQCEDFSGLPFCKIKSDNNQPVIKYWVPNITGCPGEDRAIGRYYGGLMVDYLRSASDEIGPAVLLTEVVHAMQFDGDQLSVNDGFLEVIAEALVDS